MFSPGDEASLLLEKALSSFDGIILGEQENSSGHQKPSNVLSAAQTLAMALQQCSITPSPDTRTAEIINSWLENYMPRQDSTSERVRRLQSDKDALNLQVQILNEQLAAQSNKMQDMEQALNEKNHMLTNAEDLLQREMLSRSSLETQKLELMSAMSELKLQQAALERDNLELRSTYIKNSLTNLNNNALFYNKRPPTGTNVRNLNGTSSPQHTNGTNGTLHGSHGNLPQSLSVTHKSSPEFYRQRDNIHYSSLPRQSFATSTMLSLSSTGGVNGNSADNSMTMSSPKRNVAFADADKIIDDSIDIPQRNYSSSLSSPAMSQKHKGLRGIFGKIKGNNNNNNVVEDLDGSDSDFRRGGFRATAGPRLGWSGREKVAKPFREWDPSMLCMWFEEMGLDQYNEDLCRWLKDGPGELITCAPQDIDKELNIKSPLHRKKILLALADITEQETDELFRNAAKLDTSWVLRWLEDIGLPQHKDEFFNARVDGRMLHKLTMDDLITLHVTSSLHAASLRRGIQLMRENKWNPDCLIRRSSGDVEKMKIAYWTSFCVMEWLKVVDLSEYAPNLRGAGVHGALLVYEVKFTAELLADLLAIPSSKTLLRRHLLTHFKELIGRDVIQGKRDAENTLGYQPLTISAKLKTPKKSQFSLKRKKSAKNEDFNNDFSNFVCPFGASSGENNKPPAILNATNTATTVTTPTITETEQSTKVKAP
ncbi:unnamed protein product [Diamesa tonsa]